MLAPGLALKRWLLLLIAGVGVAGLGLALFLRNLHFPRYVPDVIRGLTLPQLPDWLRGSVLIALGIVLAAVGVWRINRQMAAVLLDREEGLDNLELVDELVTRRQQRRRQSGPKVVVIGGGTGMPGLLRGLRLYTENITAVVTVADDGGSSGRLRRQAGILPPGDFRNNIAALSDAEGLMAQLLQYRFGEGDGLGNHSFGNIFIMTMASITGSFERGIAESSRVLAVRGRILPSTLDNVTLCAEISRPGATTPHPGEIHPARTVTREDWLYVRGESRIPDVDGKIVRVFLDPHDCRAYPETVQAILDADLILAAPGSFFTSLMPNLLVPHIRKAIIASQAVRFYVCNVMTQPGETDGFCVSDHMRHLRLHAGEAFTAVLANDNFGSESPHPGQDWVALPSAGEPLDYRLFSGDLVDTERPWLHDPRKVGRRVMEVYQILRRDRTFR